MHSHLEGSSCEEEAVLHIEAAHRLTEHRSLVLQSAIGGVGKEKRARERGALVRCLGHLTIDHASLSGWSTVPTPNRDTSNTSDTRYVFSTYYI